MSKCLFISPVSPRLAGPVWASAGDDERALCNVSYRSGDRSERVHPHCLNILSDSVHI